MGYFPFINCLLQQIDLSLNRSASGRAKGPNSDISYTGEFQSSSVDDVSTATQELYWCESRNLTQELQLLELVGYFPVS